MGNTEVTKVRPSAVFTQEPNRVPDAPQPYIGITGVTTQAEVLQVLEEMPVNSSRIVTFGVLVSHHTCVDGEVTDRERQSPGRFPPFCDLGHIFVGRHQVRGLLHYTAPDEQCLLDDMYRLEVQAGPYCHGFQLNMTWPDPRLLEKYRRTHSFEQRTIVLQCGTNAFAETHYNPETLAERVASYDGLIDYVLLDQSGGRGIEFSPGFMWRYLTALKTCLPHTIGVGVAGGLYSGNVERLRSLLREAEFSIDAEGRLRNQQDDTFSVQRARAYLSKSIALFREEEPLM